MRLLYWFEITDVSYPYYDSLKKLGMKFVKLKLVNIAEIIKIIISSFNLHDSLIIINILTELRYGGGYDTLR